jgi:NAD(P)-dependent dehydrogenase (short-subunit alcohol dehydrogenase family)
MNRLNSKVALITGAARGIGAAIAQAVVAEGARVYVTDIDDAAGSAFAASLGAAAYYRRLDVRDEDAWQRVTDEICGQHGGIDIVVNNAGITGFEQGGGPHDPENARLDDWRAVHRTNLDGVFLGCKYAIRAMRKRGAGSIINVSSRSGLVGIPAAAAYASSKAGVRNHTKSVALYCAQQGLRIRCNSIHPAAILTPMWDALLGGGPDREARMRQFVRDTPLRRFGTPEEVAAVAVMLAADEAQYMTGAELTIDGGILAGSAAAPGGD